MIALMECPVCTEVILPPVVQCTNGHLICSSCDQKLKKSAATPKACPVCKTQTSVFSRNLAVERLLRQTSFPCKNHWMGCKDVFRHDTLSSHQENCEYMCHKCPVVVSKAGRCGWYGPVNAIAGHIQEVHQQKYTVTNGMGTVLVHRYERDVISLHLQHLMASCVGNRKRVMYLLTVGSAAEFLTKFTMQRVDRDTDVAITVDTYNLQHASSGDTVEVVMTIRCFAGKDHTELADSHASSIVCGFKADSIRKVHAPSQEKRLHLHWRTYKDFLDSCQEGVIEWSMQAIKQPPCQELSG